MFFIINPPYLKNLILIACANKQCKINFGPTIWFLPYS